MAKQRSGLGRGLNALFDETPVASAATETTKEVSEKKEEKPATTAQSSSQTKENVAAPVSNPGSTAQQASKAEKPATAKSSSDIYFSEDELQHAKVVFRESRTKVMPGSGSTARKETERVTASASNPSTVTHRPVSTSTSKPVTVTQRPAAQSESTSQPNKVTTPAKPKVETPQSSKPTTPTKPAPTPVPVKKAAEKGDTGVVELNKVQPNPDQPRTNFKPEEIEELANSIKKEGLLQPILVRKVGDHYQIIAGERRWQACKKLDMKEIPVRFWSADNDKALELALIENIQRSDLNPIEEAYGYKRLMERKGMTQSEVAQTVSKGRSTIANALRLLDLPEEAQQLLFEDKITAGHARAILSIPDAEGRKTLTNKLMNEKLSVRETESIARLLSGRAKAEETGATKRVPAPASFKKAARGLTRFLSVPVRVKTVQGKNKIEIQFKDEEELERIIALISEAKSTESKEAE